MRDQSKKSQHTFQTVVCNACGLNTVLDPESATTLISMYHEVEEEHVSPVPQTKNLKDPEYSEEKMYYSRDLPRQNESLKSSVQIYK